MKLSSKLYLGFGLGLAVIVFISAWMVVSLLHNNENIKRLNNQASLIISIKDKEIAHLDWASKAKTGLLDATSTSLDIVTDPHKCTFGAWYYGRGRKEAEAALPAITQPLRDIEAYHDRLHRSAEGINESLALGNREAALQVFTSETAPSLGKMREQLGAINMHAQEALKAIEKEAFAYSAKMTSIIIVLCVAALLGGAIVAFFLITGIMRQLGGDPSEVARAAKAISKKDLTVNIEYNRNAPDSALAAMNRMASSLESVISEIIVTAHDLVEAISQISSGNSSLSQRSSEQAAAIEEIAATLEQTTSMIKQNADNAYRAQDVSQGTSRMAEEGGAVIFEAVNSINEVNKSSKKISEIIAVINEIAFQTNLLALNAAVEAARAGEQGKGFAVVADEVRSLAQRSGNAAREISSLIEDSVKKVENATNLANKGRDALDEIIRAVQDTGRLISGVAAASEEQLRGINQINTAVSEIDSLTQQDAALVEETAAASEEVTNQAESMLRKIEGFKIHQE